MKAFYSISIFLFFAVMAVSQPYYHIAEQNKIWNKCTKIYPMNGAVHLEYSYRTDSILSTDSIISSAILVKGMEYQEWTYVGTLKEDTINKKVYFNNRLLFDFNLNIGDTVLFNTNDTMYYTCYNIDSVLVQSVYKKRFFIYTNNTGFFIFANNGIWIEGIGDENRGICNAGINGGGLLGAVYKDGQEIFYAQYCNGITSIAEHTITSVSIYPNPVVNQIDIYIPADALLKFNSSLQFLLYDLTGRLIATKDLISEKTLLPTNQLSPSIYYWHIVAENKLLKTGKLAKQ